VIPAGLPEKSSDDGLLDRYLDLDGHPRLSLDSGEKIPSGARLFIQLENAQIALAVAQRAGVDHDAPCGRLVGPGFRKARRTVRAIGNMV